MIGALWTGISGLAGQQTALDNESHNIANVNTIGYKASRISFADQLYQDKIGKGTKVLDAEKLFTQGNLKLTGVAYDMAISGDGFFSVKNERASGTAETFFTRAGNFRMGDNGTLQDSAGNEVQGWGMTAIDPDTDVTSTNPNVNVFTTDFTKLVSSKVISHSSYVETITAKTTNFSATAEADTDVFEGAGGRTKSSKVADVEELISNYTSWLQKYQEDPEKTSASSTSQYSQIKFEGTDLKKEGDQIYVFINGEKVTQSFVADFAQTDADGDGIDPNSSVAERAEDNLAASKIATYKALADQITEKFPGLVAYTVKDSTSVGTQGTFEANDVFTKTTFDPVVGGDREALLGMIEIKSLIPGEIFTVTEVAEVSGETTTQGTVNTTASATSAVVGSGLGALQSSKEALARAVTGSQRDVFTKEDLGLGNADISGGTISGEEYTFEFVVYDKSTKQNVTVGPIQLNGVNTIQDIVDALPLGGTTPTPAAATLFNNYFKAENINGNLVISTNDANYDVEYSTTLTANSKAFQGTTSLDGSNREVVTYDQTFLPTPDAVKDYSLEFTYGLDAPVTSGLNTSSVVVDTSSITTYPTDFTFAMTFDDVNNSIQRGGSNQTIEFTVNATSEADLATKIQAQLDAINPGEFTVPAPVAAIPKVDTITFQNKAILDTESITINIDGTDYTVLSANGHGPSSIAGNTITVDDTALTSEDQIATAFAQLVNSKTGLTATATGGSSGALTVSYTSATAVDPVITNGTVNSSALITNVENAAFALGVTASDDTITFQDIGDGDTVSVDINGVTYTAVVDSTGVAGAVGNTYTFTAAATANDVATQLGALIDADAATNLTDGTAAVLGATLNITGVGTATDTSPTNITYTDNIVTSAVETTAYVAGTVGTINIQNTDPSAAEPISEVTLSAIRPSIFPPRALTPTTLGATTTLNTANVVDYSNDFTFSFDYVDADGSEGPIGASYTRTFTVSDAGNASVADLIADMNAQLAGTGLTASLNGTNIDVVNGDGGALSGVSAQEVFSDTVLNIANPTDAAAIAAEIERIYGDGDSSTYGGGQLNATVDTNGNLVVTLNDAASGGGDSNFVISLKETSTDQIIEKNADHSGREGAGAEFLEVVNKIDQVASQGSLQLRLDTLGISDSAFGEFKVDNTGLITMKQDGAEFAIGQVSIALFNNTRGLEPYGDNLMGKTTNSGDPIYNTNNERTANIEGGTLELSTADLSESLVNLMVFQRAFEANAKTITTSDALLNTLINLKR